MLEASVAGAEEELATPSGLTPPAEVEAYLDALVRFLAHSAAGAAYRTLLGAAQHDPAVKQLIASHDVLGASARAVIERIAPGVESSEMEAARLIGPAFFWIMSGRDPAGLDPGDLAQDFMLSARAQ